MSTAAERRARLAAARLYFVTDAATGHAAARGARGRRGHAPAARPRARRRRAAGRGRALSRRSATSTARCCGSTTAPTWRCAAGADGVHVGQDDMPVAEAREQVGRRPADRPLHPLARAARGRHRRRGRPAQRRARCGRRRPSPAGPPPGSTTCATRPRGGRPCRGSPSAASTRQRRPRWPPAGAERVVVVRAIRDAADPRRRGRRAAGRARGRPRWRSAVAASSARSASARAPRSRGGEAEVGEPARARADFMARGYARGRAKDEAARAALKPLAPGERPAGGDGGRARGRWWPGSPTSSRWRLRPRRRAARDHVTIVACGLLADGRGACGGRATGRCWACRRCSGSIVLCARWRCSRR